MSHPKNAPWSIPMSNKGNGINFLLCLVSLVTWLLLCAGPNSFFIPFICLQLEVMLEDNLTLPSNGKLYSKVLNWVQRSLWENGDQLERLMEEVSIWVWAPRLIIQFLPYLFLSLSVSVFDMKESFRGLN